MMRDQQHRSLSIKKVLAIAVMGSMALLAALVNLACNTSAPSSPGFQSPVQTISANNPTLTFTATFTNTATPTATSTSTPYQKAALWTGFNSPSAIAVDGTGNVYVADTANNLVKKYLPNGLLDASWGNGGLKGKIAYTDPVAVAVDSNNNLYVAGNGVSIAKFDAFGSPSNANFAASVTNGTSAYTGLAVGPSNYLYISDAGNQKVFELSSAGVSLNGFTSGASMRGLGLDSAGDVFVAVGNTVVEYSSGIPVLTIPGFLNPTGLWLDSANNLWVADTGNKQIEEFTVGHYSNLPLVIFNNGGQLVSPKGVAVDLNGNIYVADSGANDVAPFAP